MSIQKRILAAIEGVTFPVRDPIRCLFLMIALVCAPLAHAVWNESIPIAGSQQVTQGATVRLVLTNGQEFTGTVEEVTEDDDDRKIAILRLPGDRPPGEIVVASVEFMPAAAGTAGLAADRGNWSFAFGVGVALTQSDYFVNTIRQSEAELANDVLPGLGVTNISTASSADDSGTGFSAEISATRWIYDSGGIYLKFGYFESGEYDGQATGSGTAGPSQVDISGSGSSELTSITLSVGYEHWFSESWGGYLGLGTMQVDLDDSFTSSLSVDGAVVQEDSGSGSDDTDAAFFEAGLRYSREFGSKSALELDAGVLQTDDLFMDESMFSVRIGARIRF